MKRLVLAILVVAACSGGTKKQDTTTGSGSESATVYAKKLAVGWGISQKGSSAEIFLQTTDETGKQTSYPVGTFQGTCELFTPGEEMKALSGVRCMTGPSGTELHVVAHDGNVIVLKLAVQTGVTPDPMAREEVTRVKAPAGAKIEAA